MPSTRTLPKIIASATVVALGLATLGSSPAHSAKPGADHAIKTKGTGASGRMADAVTFTVIGTYSDGSTRVLKVRTDSNADGGLTAGEGELRVTCSGRRIASAVFTARDSGSGLATGKRQHTPVPIRSAVYRGNWDLKQAKGARTGAGVPASAPVVLDSTAAEICSR